MQSIESAYPQVPFFQTRFWIPGKLEFPPTPDCSEPTSIVCVGLFFEVECHVQVYTSRPKGIQGATVGGEGRVGWSMAMGTRVPNGYA